MWRPHERAQRPRAETPECSPTNMAHARPSHARGGLVWTRRQVAPDARSAGTLILDLQPPKL